jgi:hypothetical protein
MKKYLTEWNNLLQQTKIDPMYFDKIIEYIDKYIIDIININSEIPALNFERTIPVSLRILEQIDLSKVEFFIPETFLEVMDYKIEADKIEGDINIINEVSQFINKQFEEGYNVKIYRVIQFIKEQEDKTVIFSRMRFYK